MERFEHSELTKYTCTNRTREGAKATGGRKLRKEKVISVEEEKSMKESSEIPVVLYDSKTWAL